MVMIQTVLLPGEFEDLLSENMLYTPYKDQISNIALSHFY